MLKCIKKIYIVLLIYAKTHLWLLVLIIWELAMRKFLQTTLKFSSYFSLNIFIQGCVGTLKIMKFIKFKEIKLNFDNFSTKDFVCNIIKCFVWLKGPNNYKLKTAKLKLVVYK